MREHALFLGGVDAGGSDEIALTSPYDESIVARIARGGPAELEEAAELAFRSCRVMAALSPAERAGILQRAAEGVAARREELALILVEEAGKPLSLARGEVDRCVDTLNASAGVAREPVVEARDLGGWALGRLALIRRVPVGAVLAITPFNFPLNLVAHKLGPAIAAGCPVVLKPATQTPGAALVLADILRGAGLPPGGLSVIPCRASHAQVLAEDPRFALTSFTGSMDVGWKLKKMGWKRRVSLELGGNAAVIVDEDAGDIVRIAEKIAGAAFAFAGQSCISVQRVFIHEKDYIKFRRALVEAAESFPTGNPVSEATRCGPVIDESNARRLADWTSSAVDAGGRLLCGGTREGRMFSPTLLEEVPSGQHVVESEVFGPLAILEAFEDFNQAIHMVNDSRYGLQAGIFTRDLAKIRDAWDRIEVGGIIQGDVPTWRSDPMPYGGVKDSGTGREGPEWAVREMTEERLLVLSRG